MFDIPSREAVDIIWVNNLDESAIPPVGNSCMNQSYVPSNNDTHFCYLMGKVNRTQTFVDPTGFTLSTPINHSVRIAPNAWPTTIHVHGAEVRPTFDGNPLSWTDNGDYTGHVGVGTFSMTDKCYYEQFDKVDNQAHIYNPPNIYLKDLNGIIQKNFKMNRYPNLQNPGTLWYHDHAMRLTTYNVQYGLAGFYILRDKHVEEQIGVDRQN
uniref:Multicopper oxidase LPR2 n=2 Tax=Noccaea caerulescens TaxID=107243 RepID=A0A1J3DM87_NOCCA